MNDTETLKGLIEMAVERHQASARQLAFKAQGAGLKITYTTLNQIRSNTYKSVPGNQTIRAIAWLAGVEDSVAFTAAGQPVPGPPLADELPPGADHLSPKSRKAVVEMVRVLVDLESSTNAQRTPESIDTPPRLRAVAPEGDPRPGQKTEPASEPPTGNDIELQLDQLGMKQLHATEAENYPIPDQQGLAALNNYETDREKFNRAQDRRGEHNQDGGV